MQIRFLILLLLFFSDGFVFRTRFVRAQAVASVDSSSATTESDAHVGPSTLELRFEKSKQSSVYQPIKEAELKRFETLLQQTITSPSPLQLQDSWSKIEWNLERIFINQEPMLLLSELSNARRGRGFYLIRERPTHSIVLQAPHRFFDRYSGTIALRMICESGFWAAGWNTVHRKQIDVAHSPRHYMNAFTRVLLSSRSDAMFVQVHGFSKNRFAGKEAEIQMIVSDGTRHPNRSAHLAATYFKEIFSPTKVRLYPLEINELGGTTNSQRRMLTSAGSVGFLHLELHPDTRNELKNSQERRAQFIEALAKSATTLGNHQQD